MVEVCNITNKNQSPSNLAKYQYFYTREFTSFLHFRKNWRTPSQGFSKHPHFTTFSLFLKASEVCNISNKWLLPDKSVAKIFLHKIPETAPSFQQKICALPRTSF